MEKVHSLLLIDDDPVTTFINQRLIKKLKICEEVATAPNGELAIGALKKRNDEASPALIFLDINMPVMNGFEFMENFNLLQIPNKSSITIVVLTTSSRKEDLDKMKQLGIKYFLQKPLKEETIHGVLKKINEEVN